MFLRVKHLRVKTKINFIKHNYFNYLKKYIDIKIKSYAIYV